VAPFEKFLYPPLYAFYHKTISIYNLNANSKIAAQIVYYKD